MKFLRKVYNSLNSRAGSYVFFVLSVFSLVFMQSAVKTYSWINRIYGETVVLILYTLCAVSIVINIAYLIFSAIAGEKRNESKPGKAFGVIHLIFSVIGAVMFIYSLVLVFGLDSGITAEKFIKGLKAAALIYPALSAGFGLVLVFCNSGKQALKSIISGVVICSAVISMTYVSNLSFAGNSDRDLIKPEFSSENLIKNASITFESLSKDEKADAQNLLKDDNSCWTAQSPVYAPADSNKATNNSVAEIKLDSSVTFNTAVIEEVGNDVEYFRLQALIDGEWVNIYQTEKIQSMRVCSFDTVTTDCIRLSIDKFRDDTKPVKIKSLKLYNEPKRNAYNFEVTAYQRLDGDIPSEILKKGEDYAKNYARFYDVYSTVIVFAAVHWDEDGNMNFGEAGEEKFAEELNALKQIIAMRSNKEHNVKLIVTALADGAWGNGHNGVNTYMAKHWEKVADKIVEMTKKYDFDGVDIDWEYPATASDWAVFDKFIGKLNKDLKEYKSDSIISAALSAGLLGLSKETYDCIDQIQFMAYDGCDVDGYQSSLQQAQEGLRDFVKNGADISKINIGVAAYGRPVNSSAYWATWRDLKTANYWDNKYYNVPDSGQVYDGTFCSPASAGDKTAYAMLTGAGGVMVFRVGCDKTMDDENSVARGIENTLNRYFDKW